MFRNKRKNKIYLFLIMLLVVTVGYSFLSTTLKINGTANIKGNTWDIRWDSDSIEVLDGSVSGSAEVSDDGTIVTYNANLKQPGDYYEFTVDAINAGTVDGMLSIENVNPIITDENDEIISLPKYIKYSLTYADGIEIEKNHKIAKREDATHPTREKYKIKLEFDKDTEVEDLPDNSVSIKIENKVPYDQANDKATEREKKNLKTYIITFDANGGSVNPTTKEVKENGRYGELPIPIFDNHTFVGWYLNDEKITSKDEVKIEEDTTLVARYITAEYTITYKLNGGKNSENNPLGYNVDSEEIVLEAPTRKGYTFTGWTGSNGVIPEVEVIIPKGSTGNKEYIANWTKSTYAINYELNGGENPSKKPEIGTYGDSVEISNPTKNYILNFDTNGEEVTIKNSNGNMVTSVSSSQTFKGWTSDNYGADAKTGTNSNPSIAWNGETTKNNYFKNLTEKTSVNMIANWEAEEITLPTIESSGKICGFATGADKTFIYSSGDTFKPSTEVNEETLYVRCGEATFAIGDDFNRKIKMLSGTITENSDSLIMNNPFWWPDNNIVSVQHTNNIDNKYKTEINLVSDSSSPVPIFAWFDSSNETIYWWSEYSEPYLNENSGAMFANLNSLVNIDLNNFDMSKVKKIDYMFGKCASLINIDLSSFDTSSVTNMNGLFAGCSKLISLDLSNFSTSNVISFNSMFAGCSGLTTLNLNNFDTSNANFMSEMFYNCSNLKNINLSSFNTNNVTEMYSMFLKCESLSLLDLTSFDTSKVTNFGDYISGGGSIGHYSIYPISESDRGMFSYSRNLSTIYVSNRFIITSDANNMDRSRMFTGCDKLVGGRGSEYIYPNYSKEYAHIDEGENNPGYFTSKLTSTFDTGSIVNNKLKNMAGSASNIREIKYTNFENNNGTILSTSNSETNIYGWYDNGVVYIHCDAGKIYFNPDSSYMFAGLSNVINIDLANFDTSKVTNMEYMFVSCSKLENLDLKKFNTSNVVNMSTMFAGCSSLKSLQLDTFKTSNLTNMSNMFAGCSSLTSLNLSTFDVSKVSNFNGLFSSLSNIKSINISNWNFNNVTSLYSFFSGNASIETIVLKNVDTSKITNMGYMFVNLKNLTKLDLSSFDTSKVTNMDAMFNGCAKLQTIYASDKFTVDSVASSSGMFGSMSSDLKGGNGTTWSSSNPVDKTYAHIDGGSSNPGYFTSINSMSTNSVNSTTSTARQILKSIFGINF